MPIIKSKRHLTKLVLETIVFELDGTLITSAFKKHQMMGGHDSAAYVKPLSGHNKFKLYLSYRSYMIEMLS